MKRFIKLIYWLLTNRYSHILLGVVVVASAISEFGAYLIYDLTDKNRRGLRVGHAAAAGVAAHDPQELSVGQSITVQPDVNGGEQPVAGKLRYADAETVVIERFTEDVGTVCVHFPRFGYRIGLM